MFAPNLVPGQGFQPFTIYEQGETVTATGRPVESGITATDKTIHGMLMESPAKEKEQWKQNGHPITHEIIQFSAQNKAKATNYLVAMDGREFYIQGIKNPGDLNVTVIYYVEERRDIVKKAAANDEQVVS